MSGTSYRFEIAKQGRAGCQNSACKKDDIKIQKGEFRMGTLVQFQEHTSWKWKHWGCVTPRQIANLQEQVDGLDLDHDLAAIIDGYDEVPDWAQEKIKFALQNGHVPDEDWRGVPELNRQGQKGINQRTPKKVNDDEQEGAEDVPSPSKSKAKKSRSKKVKVEEDEEEGEWPSPSPPKKRAAGRKRKTADVGEDGGGPVGEHAEKAKKKARAKKAEAGETDEDVALGQKSKVTKSKKVKTEVDDDYPGDAVGAQSEPSEEVIDEKSKKGASKGKRGKKGSHATAIDTVASTIKSSERPTAKEKAVRKERSKKIKDEVALPLERPATIKDEDEDEDIKEDQQQAKPKSKSKSKTKVR